MRLSVLCRFLRPRDILESQAGQSEAEKQLALLTAIQTHYQSLYDRAVAKRTELDTDVPIIMTGHLTTVGAKTSESVRDIYIGTLDAFPAGAFPPADYIAPGIFTAHSPSVTAAPSVTAVPRPAQF